MTSIAINGGTIDKYIGDALMIFFGDPESLGPKKDAINCVKMAIEMQNKLVELGQNGLMKVLQIHLE